MLSFHSTPLETMLDDLLMLSAMGQVSEEGWNGELVKIGLLFGDNSRDLWEEYMQSRRFSPAHHALLGRDQSHANLSDALLSTDSVETLKSVIDIPDARGRTALAWAVEYRWAEATRILIQAGANVHRHRTSLHGHSPLLHLGIAGSPSENDRISTLLIVDCLVQAGANINATDHEGWTPFHVAISWDRYDIAKRLARSPSLDYIVGTNAGQTAFDMACERNASLLWEDLF